MKHRVLGKQLAKEAIENSNKFLDSLVENIPDMIFVKDAQELRFVRFNKAGEELLGYPRSHLIGKNDYDFFPKKEADFFTQKDRQVLKSGKLYDIPEEPIHTRFKGTRILHTKKIPIFNGKGKAAYLLGISEDITDRKVLEKNILDISEREQRRLGQDLHDGLGQFLTGISFLSKVLAQKLKNRSRPESSQATQISKLINQAIAQTKDLARGLNPVSLEGEDLTTSLEELALATRKLYNVSCRLDCDVEIQLSNPGDAIQIYRIVQEAINNALTHGGASKIIIKSFGGKVPTLLSVYNNGRNLPKNFSKKRGMGIHNMAYRARLLGANLEIRNSAGGGTIVNCFFENPNIFQANA